MKYIRKISVFVLVAIFLVTSVICLCVLFAVKNVNVTLKSYSCQEDSEQAKKTISDLKDGILGDLHGALMFTVGRENVQKSVKDSKYVVESYEKVFPCTLNITIIERREVYAVQKSDGSYSIYDENGDYLRKALTEEDAVNSVDNAPNLLIEGTKTDEDIKKIAIAGVCFKNLFQSLRSITEKIEHYTASSSFESERMIFHLRSGIKLEIWNCNECLSEKIEAGYIKFNSLSAIEKLKGSIYCYKSEDGEISTTYNPNAN